MDGTVLSQSVVSSPPPIPTIHHTPHPTHNPIATATGVSLSMLIHALSFDRRKAQGRSVYACALVYSYALKLLPWIKVYMGWTRFVFVWIDVCLYGT